MGSELKTLEALASVVSVWVLHVVCITKTTLRHFLILIHVPFCTMTNKCTIISQIITLQHVSALSCHSQGACNQYLAMSHKHKTYVKHLNCKLYYQQLHLKYLCKLARYWLQAPWGWHDSVKTCRVIICEIILLLLVVVQNKKKLHWVISRGLQKWYSVLSVLGEALPKSTRDLRLSKLAFPKLFWLQNTF